MRGAGVLLGQQPAAQPETVMVRFHAKAGGEAALARVIGRHWDAGGGWD